MLLFGMPAPHTLEVGPGRTYPNIEAAVGAALKGDSIAVYPSPEDYRGEHVRVQTPNLTIYGAGKEPVVINGSGFVYSGSGSTPRAIFEFEPGGDGSTVRNFDLSNAHNAGFNGAGVRINQAKNVSIRECRIHDNDMGIMSGGQEGDIDAAANQLIDHCVVHDNGAVGDPGYNHNLYLGGTSVTVQFSEIYAPLTGHNIKSRAHYNLIQYCYVHDSKNREMDFVDSFDTIRADSNTVLIGNVIAKSPTAQNRDTIHFGKEAGTRIGTLYMVNNTVVTPFAGPVVELDSTGVTAEFYNNVIYNVGQAKPALFGLNDGAPEPTVGVHNWISQPYKLPVSFSTCWSESGSPFFEATGYQESPGVAIRPSVRTMYRDGDGIVHLARPRYRYMGPSGWVPTKEHFIGAG